MPLEELTRTLRLLGVGEPHRGYGHHSSEEIAEILLAHFSIEHVRDGERS